MRIVYFAHVNGGSRSGVFHKINGQLQRWRADGRSVLACLATRDDPAEWSTGLGESVVRQYAGYRSRVQAMTSLVQAARGYAPDLIYLRWDLFYPPMLAFPRRVPLVIEVNTDDLEEYRYGSRVRALYNRWSRGLIMRRARGMVFVTSELCNSRSFRAVTGRRRVITNGIDLTAYPELPATATTNPRLVFVGTAGQPWHGLDKLLTLARLREDWRFDIVGSARPDGDDHSNVTWHGPLSRAAVLPILGRADVGVGTLALHRTGMSEACSLKLREYLAVGLPVLYAHVDRDVDGLRDNALRVANTESNVSDELERIVPFVHDSRGRRVARAAVQHIDVSRKEEQRMELFDSLA